MKERPGSRRRRPPGLSFFGVFRRSESPHRPAASEGDAPIVECLSAEGGACRIAPSCRLKGFLVDAFDALYDSLDRHTLAKLVEHPRPLTRVLMPAGRATHAGGPRE